MFGHWDMLVSVDRRMYSLAEKQEVLFLPLVNGAFRPNTKVWHRPVPTCCS